MRWKYYKEYDYRVKRHFAWLPKIMPDGERIWLESYWALERLNEYWDNDDAHKFWCWQEEGLFNGPASPLYKSWKDTPEYKQNISPKAVPVAVDDTPKPEPPPLTEVDPTLLHEALETYLKHANGGYES